MKKMISLLLALTMVFCIMSVPASAASKGQNSQLALKANDVTIGATGVVSIAGDYI